MLKPKAIFLVMLLPPLSLLYVHTHSSLNPERERESERDGLDSYEETRSRMETRLEGPNLVVHLCASSPPPSSFRHCHLPIISLSVQYLQRADELHGDKFQDFALFDAPSPDLFHALESA